MCLSLNLLSITVKTKSNVSTIFGPGARNLGITLDENLRWNVHIYYNIIVMRL